MITKTVFVCEICGVQHTSADLALKCEAKGRPVFPAYLEARLRTKVPAFGTCGVTELAPLGGYEYESGTHNIIVWGGYWGVSDNCREESGLPLCALDPMSGYDFLRYVSSSEILAVMTDWTRWCREYGLDPTKYEDAGWFEFNTGKQQLVREAMEKILGTAC